MKKIIILSLLAVIIRFLLVIYFVPTFEKSEISKNLNSLKVYKLFNKINNQRPFQSNKDIQYFSKNDLNNEIVKKAYSKRSLRMNDDEEQNYAIAVNFLKGDNYSIFDHENNTYRIRAQQHSFQVFVYKFFIEKQINFDYFIFIFIFLNIFLFFLSIIFFYKLSLIFLNNSLSRISTLAYCVYPSILFYIGPLFLYENIVLSLIVISSYLFLKNNNYLNFLAIIPFATLSLLLRFQTIFVWILFFTFFTFSNFYNYKKIKSFIPIILFIFIAFMAHKPIFEKNYILFGKNILTTDPGINFYIGANKFARGSWDGTGQVVGKLKSKISSNLNDLEIGQIYYRASLDWIKSNPSNYLILQIRKLAIYFLPQNYSVLPYNKIYNPINLLFHFGFVLFFLKIIANKDFKNENFIILSPILGSLIISLLFFIGYRWRYYAEPFMILTTIILFSKFKRLNKN